MLWGALSETKNWYEDMNRLVTMSYPWIYCGHSQDRSDGIFSYGHTCSGEYNSTRVVFV